MALLSLETGLPNTSVLKVTFIPTSVRAEANAKTLVNSDLKIFPRWTSATKYQAVVTLQRQASPLTQQQRFLTVI